MKIITAILALLALTASLCLAAEVVNLTSPQAKELLAKNARVVLLDVRTPEEFRQAHLRGALLIPVGELEQRLREVPTGKPLLVYCSVGARSRAAAGFLVGKGFQQVYQMSDGLMGWYKNGFPMEIAGRP